MIRKFAEWMITHRFIVLGITGLVTLFFAWQIRSVEVKTIFDDLLPLKHPYIKVYKKYEEQLGDPLKVLLVLQVKDGDIYNKDTLEKVMRITHQLRMIPGVNQSQIYSIGSPKIKKVTVTSDSIFTENLMDKVPGSREEMEEFKSLFSVFLNDQVEAG